MPKTKTIPLAIPSFIRLTTNPTKTYSTCAELPFSWTGAIAVRKNASTFFFFGQRSYHPSDANSAWIGNISLYDR